MGNSRIASIGNGIMTQPSGIDVVKRQEEAAEVMFADLISMNGSTDVDNFATDVADEMLGTVETNELDTQREKPADAYEKYQYKDKMIRTESSDAKPEKLQETVTEVEEFEEAVTEIVAEELHISKEELEAAMEELGLTYLDLLDNGNLANLVAKLTGSENLNQLLCNETFTNVLQQVNALGKELLTKVQMTPEELMEVQKLFEQSVSTEAEYQNAVHSEAEAITTEVTAESIVENIAEDVMESSIGVATEEVAEEVNVIRHTKAEVISDTENVEEAVEEDVKMEGVRVEASGEKQMDMSEENLSGNEKQELPYMRDEKVGQTRIPQGNETVIVDGVQRQAFTEQLSNFETAQPLPTHVTVADIMEQFTEQARVLVSVDTTKMEMQLNPEHLGKLYVEVIENEGAITAKIQTQNAVVKEALEMQIADLKVSLNQAGVKVDSVEVTIASHEFERNLEQDANSKKQQEDAEPKAARHRNINLNGLDDLSGLMTEEETLVAKMMAEQGNSVDFTA